MEFISYQFNHGDMSNSSSSAQLFFQVHEINIFPSHSNQPSSLPFELIDRFQYKGEIGFKLVKIPYEENESDGGRLQHLRW